MTKIAVGVLGFSLMAASGCMPQLKGTVDDVKALTPDQTLFLAEIEKEVLEFDLPKDQANDAWGRAQSWVAQYSPMKIQTATDFVLQTYNPPMDGGYEITKIQVYYGYEVSRAPMGDKVKFRVVCNPSGYYYKKDVIQASATRNAKMLAHHIRTGAAPRPELISR